MRSLITRAAISLDHNRALTDQDVWYDTVDPRIPGYYPNGAIGDVMELIETGYIMMDTYDNRIYAIGKGPSATMVSTQNDVLTLGTSSIIKGTVMDVSAGTETPSLRARFPNGVPAVSDESMLKLFPV